MTLAAVLPFTGNDLSDIPAGLRRMADEIEAGGDVHAVAWVADYGDSDIRCGALGALSEPGAQAHLLFAIAQRKLEGL